jgi:hypothetical protein
VSESKEKTALETLAALPKNEIVLVGGYAVNAYAPPRFSADCDVVVLGNPEPVESELERRGFAKSDEGDVPYGSYIRYERTDDKASFDLLVNSLVDNRTGIVFEGELFKTYSSIRRTVGRLVVTMVQTRIVDPELLFTTKFVPARRQDARDMFMLSGISADWSLAESLIRRKCPADVIDSSLGRIKEIIEAPQYRDQLQSAYGLVPNELFARCKKNLGSLMARLS